MHPQLAVALWAAGNATGGFHNGVRVLLEGLFQSPYFLYHVETGGPRGAGPLVELTGDELANRLSYFLWDSLPDDALRSAAQSGELADPVKLEAQVLRMLDDPRAATGTGSFHVQWLGLDAVSGLQKDAALFPAWSPALAASTRGRWRPPVWMRWSRRARKPAAIAPTSPSRPRGRRAASAPWRSCRRWSMTREIRCQRVRAGSWSFENRGRACSVDSGAITKDTSRFIGPKCPEVILRGMVAGRTRMDISGLLVASTMF